MPDKIEEIKTYKINEVEIFSAGKWNEDEYSVNDLHEIVRAFESIKVGFRPYLKLGHNDKQQLAKSSGLPSIGWVDRLYVRGTKLLADFTHIPEKVYKLIKAKAYRKVSCEIYWNLTVDGNKYSRVLGGVALLGAENPGVMNLDDILGNYSFKWGNEDNRVALFEKEDNFKTYSHNLGGQMADEKSEKEIELEKELENQKKEYAQKEEEAKKLAEEKTAFEKEVEELKAYKIEMEKREADALAKAEEARRSQFVSELEGKKLATPAMKPLLFELLTDKKEYSINEKAYSKEQLVEDILTLASEASKVNMDEKTRSDYGVKENELEKMEEKIKEYMKEHKCDYMQAHKAVVKDAEKNKK